MVRNAAHSQLLIRLTRWHADMEAVLVIDQPLVMARRCGFATAWSASLVGIKPQLPPSMHTAKLPADVGKETSWDWNQALAETKWRKIDDLVQKGGTNGLRVEDIDAMAYLLVELLRLERWKERNDFAIFSRLIGEPVPPYNVWFLVQYTREMCRLSTELKADMDLQNVCIAEGMRLFDEPSLPNECLNDD